MGYLRAGALPGGAPANYAAHARACGGDAFILSRVGADEAGEALKLHLSAAGIDIRGVQSSLTRPTGSVHVHLDAQGQPSFECSSHTAFDEMSCNDAWLELAPRLDAILFGTLAQREKASRQAIQELLGSAPQAVKIFDLNLRGWNPAVHAVVEHSLKLCQVIKLNEGELKILMQAYGAEGDDPAAFLRGVMRYGEIELAAVTLGSRGCWLLSGDESVRHPGYHVKVADTTGCGDAFAAGLTIKYLNKATLEEMAAYANRIGALAAIHKGAFPAWSHSDSIALEQKSIA